MSLQNDVRATDAGVLASRNDIRHSGEALGDFADTAALVEHMGDWASVIARARDELARHFGAVNN